MANEIRLLCLVLVISPSTAFADDRPPLSLDVQPNPIHITDTHDAIQLVVTGRFDDGERDLTREVEIRDPAGLVRIESAAYLRGIHAGESVLEVRLGEVVTRVPVQVTMETRSTSFRREVIAGLDVGGCNAGACHGTPTGKNGFKLSLRGAYPDEDYRQLTRDVLGRRADRIDPSGSLILLKGTGQIAHEGGKRFSSQSRAVEMIEAWLREGMRDDPPDLPKLESIAVTPDGRTLLAPAHTQQVRVVARFADGSTRDVTRLSVFESSDTGIADVTATGMVTFERPGEVAILCRYLDQLLAVRLTHLSPPSDFVWTDPPEVNFVDTHTFAKLKRMSITPSDLCSDADFLRRAYLDCIGTLPTPDEVRSFLDDPASEKRSKVIDALLERPEFADYWSLKWAAVLRSSGKNLSPKGAHAFRLWLRGHLARNTPFDQLTRELLTAQGHSYRNPAAGYYRVARTPEDLAETTAQLFLGVRMQCARCHNHPFDRWTQNDYYGLAAVFARVAQRKEPGTDPKAKEFAEIVFLKRDGEVKQPRSGAVMAPRPIGDGVTPFDTTGDRRGALADWLTEPDNPFLAKSVVNRTWYHLLGRGIVDPVDDFRDSNPAANEELLEALSREFIESGFDLKHMIRTIMNSRTYQLSAEPNDSNADDEKYFSHAVTKLLPAEVLLDAINQTTGVPEKFPGTPTGTRAIQLADGADHPLLKAFGQPARELACECERGSDSNLGQALQLVNGPTVNDKVRDPKNRLGRLLASDLPPEQVLDELYLTALSRLPDETERRASLAHVNRADDPRRGWEDVLWALINTREFLFRH